jgi:hypothetical protein
VIDYTAQDFTDRGPVHDVDDPLCDPIPRLTDATSNATRACPWSNAAPSDAARQAVVRIPMAH